MTPFLLILYHLGVMTDTETLREADKQFKQTINAVRGLILWTERQGVGERDVDTSTEEPPDY